ncbi:MAG: acyl carrier protein [Desulfobacula sp.]|jgi:acyl carrier protein
MEKLTNQVIKIIAKELDIPKKLITWGTSIQEDLGADSLDVINIIMALENKFNIEIDGDTVHQFNTVADIVDAITLVIVPERN